MQIADKVVKDGLSANALKVCCSFLLYFVYCAPPLKLWWKGETGEEFTVPTSTWQGWVMRRRARLPINAPGRPCNLTKEEEQQVFDAFKYLRAKNAPVDKEVFITLAMKAMSQNRNIPIDKLTEVTEHWVKSFRRRWKVSRSVVCN